MKKRTNRDFIEVNNYSNPNNAPLNKRPRSAGFDLGTNIAPITNGAILNMYRHDPRYAINILNINNSTPMNPPRINPTGPIVRKPKL